MEDSAYKAFSIGVGIFVSLTIISSFILVVSQMIKIYNDTEKVSVDLLRTVDEFDRYIDENYTFYGIDVINTYRKYKKDDFVEVHLGRGNKLTDEESVDKNKVYVPHLIDGNNVPDEYMSTYKSEKYKNKTIILFI